ncbi:hypothetical protein AWB77_06735 [Caballeronia fortuita]|uniref:Uncharacterized protein n=2 Tax=Caballeronia fortuita TaxID=1777138 RepID=A0A158E8W8_9BURK|nr:hypothetical protein AWB77_06735 [Caballeronia fortuita]
MKTLHAVIHNGAHVANQLAGTEERAGFLACKKLGLTYSRENTRAVNYSACADWKRAIDVACMETVRGEDFEPCEETPLADLLIRKN